jgi:hypothetical protein
MKALVSMMALAIALAWPSVGEAQSKKSSARNATSAQQKPVQRLPKAVAARSEGQRHCAGYARGMLARDIGDDN